MTDLRCALERYLSMRQGLGYKYHHQARRLADFVSFMEKRKATTISTKLAVAWATLPPDRHASWALRLTDVRGLTHEPLGEVTLDERGDVAAELHGLVSHRRSRRRAASCINSGHAERYQ